jgi:dihydrodipicolinate synthase/N-acetylneuraminate lyase
VGKKSRPVLAKSSRLSYLDENATAQEFMLPKACREMSDSSSAVENRSQLLARLFPEGVPRLWCPALTHYDREGRVDAERIAAHLRHMSRNVKGFLIPGSTGDGWELSDPEASQLLKIAIQQARELGFHLLVGTLKPDPDSGLKMFRDTIDWIESQTKSEGLNRLAEARVSGFVICPPSGKNVSQSEIEQWFETILKTGIPTALYQLPQVTQNEISAELVAGMAVRFSNFIMFKDSSGADRVTSSGKDLGGIFTVRGAEGNYAKWLKAVGGSYDGFLLSTANCFAKEFREMISDLSEGRVETANKISERLTGAVSAVFALISHFPHGNAFANANKAMDHFFAYGPKAASVCPPRLHAGSSLPSEMIMETGKILERYGLLPGEGYFV